MKNKDIYGISVELRVFGHTISVIYGDKDNAIKYIEEKTKETFKDEVKNSDGFCCKNHIYIGKNNKDVNIIVHEMVHAINNCFSERNVFWTDRGGEDEVFAYTMGYAVAFVTDTKPKEWFIYKNNKWKKQKSVK